jgi:hypothetical protein
MTGAYRSQRAHPMQEDSGFSVLVLGLACVLMMMLALDQVARSPMGPPELPAVIGVWTDGIVKIGIRPDSSFSYNEWVTLPIPLGGPSAHIREKLCGEGRVHVGDEELNMEMRDERTIGDTTMVWEVKVWLASGESCMEGWRMVSQGVTQAPHSRGADTRRFSLRKV